MVQTANDCTKLANKLRPILLRLSRELRREISGVGVTGGQVSLLAQIKKRPGITASELAEVERISAPGMSGHMARLEAGNLIERTRAADRRRIGLTLTAEGERVVATVRKQRTAWLASHLRELDNDDIAALEAALPALERLLEAHPS